MSVVSCTRRDCGSALVVTVVFMAIACATLAGVLSWAQSSARLTGRNNEYQTTLCAAESAIERVRGEMAYDYLNKGEPTVAASLNRYSQLVPSSADGPEWAEYRFSDPTQPGRAGTLVKRCGSLLAFRMSEPYEGLTAFISQYQIIANVVNAKSTYQVPVCIGAQVNLANLPLFQFAVFYQEDMEVNPGAPMTIKGIVHGNADIYMTSAAGLTCMDSVSASGVIHSNTVTKPGDNPSRGTNVVFNGIHESNVAEQNLPVGTNQDFSANGTTAPNVHAVLDIPPVDEPYAYNQPGTNRYYNKADLILKITDTGTLALTGVWMGNSHLLTDFPSSSIVNTAETFYDPREGCNMQATALDIGALKKWSETNHSLSVLLSTLYIVDCRSNILVTSATNTVHQTNEVVTPTITSVTSLTQPLSGSFTSATITTNGAQPLPANAFDIHQNPTNLASYTYSLTSYTFLKTTYTTNMAVTNRTVIYPVYTKLHEPAIVLTNGQILPRNGLTIATPDPVYIKGHYNVNTDGNTPILGSADTSNTRPAAILADAITILSPNWKDSASSGSLSSRLAVDTTVNAAFLAGNTPTVTSYSGGLENFPRFLEDWSNQTFTYNGSMVVMFPSQIAKGLWGQANVYGVPKRNWSFDNNFLNKVKLPPNSPHVISMAHGQWVLLTPGSTSF